MRCSLHLDGRQHLALEARHLCRAVRLGTFAMPGSTLMLMLLLICPICFPGDESARTGGKLDYVRAVRCFCIAMLFLGALSCWASRCLPRGSRKRLRQRSELLLSRQGPLLAAIDVARSYPLGRDGLTGEPFIEREVVTSTSIT